MIAFAFEVVEAVFVGFFQLLLVGFEVGEFVVEFAVFLFQELILLDELVEKLVSFGVRVRELRGFAVSDGIRVTGI